MKRKIDSLLAEFLGLDPTDFSEDDSLIDDLHMTPTDLVDFTHQLAKSGFDTNSLDFSEIETLADLYDKLS